MHSCSYRTLESNAHEIQQFFCSFRSVRSPVSTYRTYVDTKYARILIGHQEPKNELRKKSDRESIGTKVPGTIGTVRRNKKIKVIRYRI